MSETTQSAEEYCETGNLSVAGSWLSVKYIKWVLGLSCSFLSFPTHVVISGVAHIWCSSCPIEKCGACSFYLYSIVPHSAPKATPQWTFPSVIHAPVTQCPWFLFFFTLEARHKVRAATVTLLLVLPSICRSSVSGLLAHHWWKSRQQRENRKYHSGWFTAVFARH